MMKCKAVLFGAALLALPSANMEAKKVGKLKSQDNLVMAAVMQKNLSDQVCPPKKARDKAFASACRTSTFGATSGVPIDFSTATPQFFGITPPASAADGFTIQHSGNYLIQYFLRPAQNVDPSVPDVTPLFPLYEINVTRGGISTGFDCSRYGSPIDFNSDPTTDSGQGVVTLLDVSGSVVLSLKAGDVIRLSDLTTGVTGGGVGYFMDSAFKQNSTGTMATTVVSAYITIEQL